MLSLAKHLEYGVGDPSVMARGRHLLRVTCQGTLNKPWFQHVGALRIVR
jgi:hypothetical protein